jgi:hypothetical protein
LDLEVSAMRLLYSQTAMPPEGFARRNPRFFVGVEDGVDAVLIDGDWPGIAEAYEAVGTTVTAYVPPNAPLAPEPAPPPALGPISAALPIEERGAVEIPEDWEALPWTDKAGTPSLRRIASLVSDAPVLKRADAEAAIRAELDRRQAEADPQAE